MRIWDVNPGYLNRQSLLGEHRELHGIMAILTQGKRGYARHPETLRWVEHLDALALRHGLLACEMRLRGYREATPLSWEGFRVLWPGTYVDSPAVQFDLLRGKYSDREPGRIPLPDDIQQLWRQHKYSVLARDPECYRQIGRDVAGDHCDFESLAGLLTQILRRAPTHGGLENALQHMQGYFKRVPRKERTRASGPETDPLLEIHALAEASHTDYILEQTALSDLMVWSRG